MLLARPRTTEVGKRYASSLSMRAPSFSVWLRIFPRNRVAKNEKAFTKFTLVVFVFAIVGLPPKPVLRVQPSS